MNAVDTYYQVLKDNNLEVKMTPLQIRTLEDGAILIDKPTLVVDFTKGAPSEPEKTEEGPVEGEAVV